jgi:ribosomal protein L3 glutamine methyltransferase
VLICEIGHNRQAVEAAFPRLPFTWLETASSSDGVFALAREEIVAGNRG